MIVVLKHFYFMFADIEPMPTIRRSHGLQSSSKSGFAFGWAKNLLLQKMKSKCYGVISDERMYMRMLVYSSALF